VSRAQDTPAGPPGESRIEVHVTTDTSAAPAGKAGEPRLYVMHDTSNPDARLYFTEAEWRAFEGGVRDGEFDLTAGDELPPPPPPPALTPGHGRETGALVHALTRPSCVPAYDADFRTL
jgi:hypothetical protein